LYEVSVFFVIKYAGDGLCLVEQWLFMLWRPNVKVRGVGRSNIECGVKTAILDSVCIVKQVSFRIRPFHVTKMGQVDFLVAPFIFGFSACGTAKPWTHWLLLIYTLDVVLVDIIFVFLLAPTQVALHVIFHSFQ